MTWVLVDSPSANGGGYSGITEVVCGHQPTGQPPPPPSPGFELALVTAPASVQWGTSETVIVRLTPDTGYVAGPVDVSIGVPGNINVMTDDPPTKTVTLASNPLEVTFSITPFSQNSKLGCFDVDIEASDGGDEEDLDFEVRVRPIDGPFVKVFDDTNGLDGFIGVQDDSCMTPSLMGQTSELVEAEAFPGAPGAPFNVNYNRNNQGTRQNPDILAYDLSPQCMVAFKRVPNPAAPGTSVFNWNTIGFARVVDRTEIPRQEITTTRQSSFGPNQVDQIWMAPDGTAHVQVTDVVGHGGRDVKAFDNITGSADAGEICSVITSMERSDDKIIIESESLDGEETCDETALTLSVPTCD